MTNFKGREAQQHVHHRLIPLRPSGNLRHANRETLYGIVHITAFASSICYFYSATILLCPLFPRGHILTQQLHTEVVSYNPIQWLKGLASVPISLISLGLHKKLIIDESSWRSCLHKRIMNEWLKIWVFALQRFATNTHTHTQKVVSLFVISNGLYKKCQARTCCLTQDDVSDKSTSVTQFTLLCVRKSELLACKRFPLFCLPCRLSFPPSPCCMCLRLCQQMWGGSLGVWTLPAECPHVWF